MNEYLCHATGDPRKYTRPETKNKHRSHKDLNNITDPQRRVYPSAAKNDV
jgi:hypothetical protein